MSNSPAQPPPDAEPPLDGARGGPLDGTRDRSLDTTRDRTRDGSLDGARADGVLPDARSSEAVPSSSSDEADVGNRRDFLTGEALRSAWPPVGESSETGDGEPAAQEAQRPQSGPTIRLSVRAMACEFSVIMNPGPHQQLDAASQTLDQLEPLEQQLSAYRADSDISQINRSAADGPVQVEPALFELLQRAKRLWTETGGGFDVATGPLIRLWRNCRAANRVPSAEEVAAVLEVTGSQHVELDAERHTVRFDREGLELNLGAIGKGFALDRCAETLRAAGVESFLLHGGHSSMVASGEHCGAAGWPVGIRNPLFTRERWATLLLRDAALSTSGSNLQFYRHQGRRWGHILDPRSGWPADQMLSVSVIAPTAELADALSTAFFVVGVEKTREYCDNHRFVSAILMPPPLRGRTLQPVLCGVLDEVLFLE